MRLLVFAIALSAGAQTMIESGLLTGAMGSAAGKAGQATGKALNGALGNTAKALGTVSAPATAVASTANTGSPAPVGKEEPAPLPVQLSAVSKVKAGMNRDEVIALLGKPSQKMTIPDGDHISERYRYTADKGWARIALEDGKVTDIETGGKN